MNSWRRSSAACPRPLTWRAPPRCAPPSAASSPAIPSSADSAPSTHRYILLPALPDHLADQVHQPDIIQCEPFLAPPADDEDSSFRDFRVMCLVRFRTKLVLFVFSSCAGQWLADPVTFDMFGCLASDRYYAHGCFCWEVLWEDTLLVFDARMMEFSTLDPPPPPSPCVLQRAIVEAGQGKLGMLTISEYTDEAGAYQYQLFFDVQHKDENGTNQWQSKSVIPLPVNYCYVILGVAAGYLLLIGFPQQNRLLLDYFSLNLQTFQIEWFCQTGRCTITGGLYADLPPSLSPPTI